MFNIVEKNEPGAFELHVYTSPRDGKTTMAHGLYPYHIHGNQVVWPCVIKFGTPVKDALRIAVEFAEPLGIPVWVNDPESLFPPYTRG